MKILALAVVAMLLAGCTGDRTTTVTDPAGTGGDTPLPTAPATPDGAVTTRLPVTVLDDGDGAELCLGAVAESWPPQCGGPKLIGWDWADHDGYYEEGSGVRWGQFKVTGIVDGDGITVTEVIPAMVWQGPAPVDETDLSTPCPEPDGGWRVLDPATTTPATLDEVMAAATRLDGYAGAWLDQSVNPGFAAEPTDDAEAQQQEAAMNDPEKLIVNVRVTGDVEPAEAELRKVWGGMLCVSAADRTEAELQAIQQEVFEAAEGALFGGVDTVTGTVRVEVTYDDGSLQDQVDQRYGEGVVEVSSALVPAE